MNVRARSIAVAVALCVSLLCPVSVFAQGAPLRGESATVTASPPALERLDQLRAQGAPSPRRRGPGPATLGALIGGTVALGATYAAARSYGNNEGGEFCTRCFVQWSAVAVPVGALAGAAIGWGIGRARPSITVTPILWGRGGGLAVAARF